MTWVIEVNKEKSLERIQLREGSFSIGREGCDLNLDDTKLSRHHCTIYLYNNLLTFVDNTSTNGSFINGKRTERADLKNLDTLLVGNSELTILNI